MLLVVSGLLVFASTAHAGSYRVWTCRAPDGSVAPIRDASSGWGPSLRGDSQFVTLEDRCANSGGIYAHMGGQPAKGWGGFWICTPPSGTSLGGFSITWSGTVGGGGEATLGRSDQVDPDYVERTGATAR